MVERLGADWMNKWIALIVAALLFAGGCEKLDAEIEQLRETDKEEESVLQVKVINAYTVEPKQDALTQQISGIVAPRKELSLSFGTSGKIAKIHVKKGSVVTAGTLLASLDTSVWQQEITAAQGQVQSANIRRAKTLQGADAHDINQQKLRLEKARQNADRAADELARGKRLYENGAISREELERLTLSDKQAKIDLQEEQLNYNKLLEGADQLDIEAANAEVKEANVKLLRAQQDINDAVLKAPFSGIVAAISQTESEQTGPGTEVMRLVDTSQWVVQLQVESEQIANWQAGKKVTVLAPDGAQAEGVVSFVSPVLDQQSGTYPVEVTAESDAINWKGGMAVTCQYEVHSQKGLLVPVTSVGISEESYYVMKIINHNTLKKEPVKVGAIYGQYYEVLEGLQPGEQIVSTGLSYVVDGEAVKVNNE
jgi:multidrug efflux pump subunit AcrA (membrane-fusion protein)